MIGEIQNLLDRYILWLKERTILREVDGVVEITTPYVDRHNDYLQIYAKRDNSGFLLSDDGYIVADLVGSGCGLDTPKRKDLLKTTLNGFGVQLVRDELQVHASTDNFAVKKHNLVQAMIAVNDMFFLSSPNVASLFYEDVIAWLELHEIRYTSKVKFTGKSGYDHVFDFAIPKSRHQPERLLKTITHPNKDAAQSAILSWVDTKEVRPPEAKCYALLNDTSHGNDNSREISSSVIDALRSYEVIPFAWSRREEFVDELVA